MLLGIDAGGTSMKAVVFQEDGTPVGVGSHRSQRMTPHPGWAERDMLQAWRECANTVRTVLDEAGLSGRNIKAVGVVGHGDGLYPVGADLQPSRPAILALDSRAAALVETWRSDGRLDRIRELTGQQLFAPSQAALAAWLAVNEPATLTRTRWFLSAKDWLRLTLTDEVATDTSEATASFGNIAGDGYEPAVAQLLDIEEILDKLPPALPPTAVAGTVSAAAAALTGLTAGTPVITGTHDVVGGALGAGITAADSYCVVVGTWGVNEVLNDRRVLDARWQSRPWVTGGQWLHVATSPASASNLNWLSEQILTGGPDIAGLEASAGARAGSPSAPLFFPFLFGSPYGAAASGSFLGLRGGHDRVDLARAVFSGVVFNHLEQIDALISAFGPKPIRLTGGGARSRLWGHLFADAAGVETSVPDVDETGCWGAAILAGVGCGVWASVDEAARQTPRLRARFCPDPVSAPGVLADRDRYRSILVELPRIWAALDNVSTGSQGHR